MAKTRTYIDANILLAAFRGDSPVSAAAMEILDDPDRDLIVSEFLELEVLPKPIYNRRSAEVEFIETVIRQAAGNVAWSALLTTQALDLAKRYGLSAIDAIHASAAVLERVDELVTGERPTKPLFRLTEVRVTSIRNGGGS